MKFEIVTEVIEPAHWQRHLLNPAAGAFCTFEGWVRNQHEGRPVTGLHYQAHPELASAEGQRVVASVMAEFALLDAFCIHRIGELEVGQIAVWVGVTAAHRDAAFAGCRAIIDQVKRRVPIWKLERYVESAPRWLHPV
jgi:molybdopterin synthase catalytic subunit